MYPFGFQRLRPPLPRSDAPKIFRAEFFFAHVMPRNLSGVMHTLSVRAPPYACIPLCTPHMGDRGMGDRGMSTHRPWGEGHGGMPLGKYVQTGMGGYGVGYAIRRLIALSSATLPFPTHG